MVQKLLAQKTFWLATKTLSNPLAFNLKIVHFNQSQTGIVEQEALRKRRTGGCSTFDFVLKGYINKFNGARTGNHNKKKE